MLPITWKFIKNEIYGILELFKWIEKSVKIKNGDFFQQTFFVNRILSLLFNRNWKDIKEIDPSKFYRNFVYSSVSTINDSIGAEYRKEVECYILRSHHRTQKTALPLVFMTLTMAVTWTEKGDITLLEINLQRLQNQVKPIKNLIGHKDSILSVIKLNEGVLASSSKDGTIRLWNLEYPEKLIVLTLDSPAISLKILKEGFLKVVMKMGLPRFGVLNDIK